MTDVSQPRPVPPRALVLSLASLAVPVSAQVLLPDLLQEYGILVWASALVPAFLMAYYRGLRGVAVAAAAGMAVLSLTQAAVSAAGIPGPDWRVLLAVVAVYVAVCVALAAVAELLHRDRALAERLALLDPLTGLPNRRFAELTLDSQFAAAARGRPLTVVLFDLDHFKRVNDQAGHDAGDATLKVFADVLRKLTRRMDFSGRIGGEEFISILSDCPLEQAAAFADRVRTALRGHAFPWGQVTVSAGVGAYEEGMASHEILVGHADRALYRAKLGGRDQVATMSPEARARPATPAPVATAPPAARVLVVDDDGDVLRAVVKLLRAGGYEAEGTTDPNIAVERFASGQEVDLLVTDVLMPAMTGIVMVDQILPGRPDLPVVYMSGYVQKGGVTWAGLPGGTVGFVQKPVEMDDLLGAVRDVLQRAAAPAAD